MELQKDVREQMYYLQVQDRDPTHLVTNHSTLQRIRHEDQGHGYLFYGPEHVTYMGLTVVVPPNDTSNEYLLKVL